MATDGRMAQGVQPYLTRRPVVLALLFAAAIVFFLAVTGLSRVYHTQQDSLGERWANRGIADLEARRFDTAVLDLRAALLYSRDNYSYQLHLAEALTGLNRTGEASAYLTNLWERQPENGWVNLDLARIAAHDGNTEQALRYYHNAIYATWPGDNEVQRRDARLELIRYLLKINARAQAQAELMALAANAGESAAEQRQIGDLFLQAQDYEHALAAYRLSLKDDRQNPAALAGAGLASFELGRYPLAEKYLQGAVAANPDDTQSAAQLKTTELVLTMDPFRRNISAAERGRIVIEAFEAAGERLKLCSVRSPSTQAATATQSLPDAWAKMKPEVTASGLRKNPDLIEKAMELVFNIERRTSATCGPPVGTDLALLLIARLHEGS